MQPIILITRPNASKKFFRSNGKYWRMPFIDEFSASSYCEKSYYTQFTNSKDALNSIWCANGIDIIQLCQQMRKKLLLIWDKKSLENIKTIHTESDYSSIVIDIGKVSQNSKVVNKKLKFSSMVSYYDQVIKVIDDNINDETFIWVNIPEYVVKKAGYTADLEEFDRLVGFIRNKYPKTSLTITALNGFHEGRKEIDGLAFELSDSIIHIPLFSSFALNNHNDKELYSSEDLIPISLGLTPTPKKYVICQSKKSIAITDGRYKYIRTLTDEGIFDLLYDPHEYNSLMEIVIRDVDRDCIMDKRQVYYYPEWSIAKKKQDDLKDILDSFLKAKDE